ncbi:CLL_collapsed_G0004650.mRNA.1.CDS.1 [Saccharomyces cerevisiae]|uniref:K7_Dug2p n=1 Tax=Saccharomyces cerevisiae (strain Kyokai no. 7 / NBRC 101557) TaxID=721032 RepID=G2W9T4_YEASK|nr:CLN_G0004780.mRNA.1.CDS.1 [Saccharomyces cerevisiae]GAA21827.1 K7_Dug2p [Saccharomyces cerevisiae Kyokai no. 7]CAI6412750.1 CLL_HP1_G0004620.mRNA.1.CDS.1 [Saccharomyces cerevisiae]CAI7160799.1 CLL_collapsed_G0004650.mRNA.1.CDS.1 [Saccharomyces cerevisiae]CAI7160922.1 CLN_G0004780.mRNA.1.CDS.1 [Saccharomyces cerevisiae]
MYDSRGVALHSELIHRWNHAFSILSIVAFPKKRLLFAGSQDSKILVFDLPTYNLMHTIRLGESQEETHTRSSVLCLTRSEDENFLFSGGADSLVRIWSIGEKTIRDDFLPVTEIATVYSVTDIGDIFSLAYLDSLETIVFGCQNASLLYVENLIQKIEKKSSDGVENINKLPHRRYDKFFDSLGPTGYSSNSLSQTSLTSLQENCGAAIIEVPSENIIKYAHYGFIYSINKLCPRFNQLLEKSSRTSGAEHIISSAGDGISKLWEFSKDKGQNTVKISLINDKIDNEDSVISQTIEFPFLYCGLTDGIIKIWDLNTQQIISTLKTKHESDVISISVYMDHVFAIDESGITHFYQNQVNHWNPQQGKILSSEIFNKSNAGSVSLLTGGSDGSLTLWDITSLLSAVPLSSNSPINASSTLQTTNSWAAYQSASLNNEEMLNTLRELISFQTVSQSKDTTNTLSLRRCAIYLQQLFLKFGATNSQLFPLPDGGNPVVFAYFQGNGKVSQVKGAKKKRILWYGHYDVISSGNTFNWNTDPFTLTCENGYLKGRGVSDNKGPLVSAIHSVAYLFQQGELVNDVVFLVEGSEEIGSASLKQVCEKYHDIIGKDIDWILLSNSTWVDQEHPCLNYGLRGVINAQIKVWSDKPDGHSGLNGGVYDEPMVNLVKIVSKLQNEQNEIMIPNFYSPLKDLTEEEYQRFQKITELANIDENTTVQDLITNWTKPSLSMTTVKFSGPGNITVIPKSVTMGISIRLVPEQSVEQVKRDLKAYLEESFKQLKSQNHLEIKVLNEAEGWLGDPTNHAYQILKDEITTAWDVEPLLVREGGSISCLRMLERIFDAPAVQIPCGQSTDNGHLANENLRIKNWSNLTEILSKVFNRL